MQQKHMGLAGVLFAVTTGLFSPVVFAQQTDNQQVNDASIERITVVATRQPRAVSDVAGTVSIIDQQQLQQNLVIDAADMVRYQVGVSVDESSTRFGNDGFRVRGIGGNRTSIIVDQVPVAEQFAVGSFSNSGRGLLELGLVNQVEVLRGPASTLYGSKALGGVVAIELLDADDLLLGESFAGVFRSGFDSDKNQARLMTAVAAEKDGNRWLLGAAAQYGEERHVDPQHHRQQAVLLSFESRLAAGEIKLSVDALNDERDTQIESIIGTGRLTNTTAMQADDQREQWRALLEYDIRDLDFADSMQSRLFIQNSEAQQYTDEQRLSADPALFIERDFSYQHRLYGVGADFASSLRIGDVGQQLGYGFEWLKSTYTDLRDAEQLNLQTAESTKVLLGEQFPLRDFPTTEVRELGVYVHNEIALMPKLMPNVTLIPGLRYEYYELENQPDALFAERYPQADVTDLSEDAWLPKLGLLWQSSKRSEVFAQYARGYRAPPFADVNVGLYYPQFGVLAISNPDLKAERGYSLEAGFRQRFDEGRWQLAVYDNSYRDFIESRAPQGVDPQQGLLIFQSVNRDRVSIKGVELEWQQNWNPRWASQVALSYSTGEDDRSGRELAGVAPAHGVFELSYKPGSGDWQSRWVLTAYDGQPELESSDAEPLYESAGYATVDWLVSWYPANNIDINIGLFNVFNRDYWHYSSVQGYEPDSPAISGLKSAERHLALNFALNF
ncbi:MAG: TonB-dependent receptor [Idiomarina sp.]|nr:TonB-dependent receptor [Idiomarina sp.]PHQ76928.1 MAG: TonB-dependent receptor [Idiomarina sp.]